MSKTTVARIVTSFSNSAAPVAWAKLACGHGGDVVLVPRRMACFKCSTVRDEPEGFKWVPCASCGGGAFRPLNDPDPHRAEDRLTRIGDEVECRWCDHYAVALAQLRALRPGDVSHSRYRDHGERGTLWVYRRDETSPSGCMLLMSIEATPE